MLNVHAAKKVDHLALEHPRFSPTSRGAALEAPARAAAGKNKNILIVKVLI